MMVNICMKLLKRKALRGHKHLVKDVYVAGVPRIMRKTDVLRAALPSMSNSSVGEAAERVP